MAGPSGATLAILGLCSVACVAAAAPDICKNPRSAVGLCKMPAGDLRPPRWDGMPASMCVSTEAARASRRLPRFWLMLRANIEAIPDSAGLVGTTATARHVGHDCRIRNHSLAHSSVSCNLLQHTGHSHTASSRWISSKHTAQVAFSSASEPPR